MGSSLVHSWGCWKYESAGTSCWFLWLQFVWFSSQPPAFESCLVRLFYVLPLDFVLDLTSLTADGMDTVCVSLKVNRSEHLFKNTVLIAAIQQIQPQFSFFFFQLRHSFFKFRLQSLVSWLCSLSSNIITGVSVSSLLTDDVFHSSAIFQRSSPQLQPLSSVFCSGGAWLVVPYGMK